MGRKSGHRSIVFPGSINSSNLNGVRQAGSSTNMIVSKRRPHQRISLGPKKKIAFVCSGGATKAGAFHLGVALALQEQGFKFYGGLMPETGAPRPPGLM